ncbi:MAG: C10 family peptidase, partial [Muribaculaceae bacterium]|nr:C10 family peptidase [Muribaculaceae bacterium]
FNATDGNGFVIISGDDRYSKVLGYSDRGSFDFKHMPPQLKAMLDQFAENSVKPSVSNSTHTSWTSGNVSTRSDEGVLLKTAEWGQGAPYNDLCPTVDGQKAPAGCVATAMAIAMKYHNWPDYTRGDVQTDYYYPELGFDFSDYTIDWKALDNQDDPKFAEEVAKLIFSAGVCNSMAYGAEESGAAVWPVGHKMIELYTYAKGNQFVGKARYSDEEWETMLRNQIKNVGPVIYCGDGNGSHCFIVDGYDANGLYHINWGWDGMQNGYFELGAAEENGNLFPNNQAMIIDLKPDKERKVYSKAFIPNELSYPSQEWNFYSPDITPGEKQYVLIPTMAQNCFNGYYGLAVVDEEDNIKEIFHVSLPQNGIRWICAYPGVFLGSDNQGDGILFPDIKEGERYQLVSMDASYVFLENEGYYKWTPEKPSYDPKDWKIVLGGIDYPSYFYKEGNQSEVTELTFHFDSDLPVYMEVSKLYPTSEPLIMKALTNEGFADNLKVPRKGVSVEVKAYDIDGNSQEVIWANSEDDYLTGESNTYNFNISTYHKYYDVYVKYEPTKDIRKDNNYKPEEIFEENGIIYTYDANNAVIIGYDQLSDNVTIPSHIITPLGKVSVLQVRADAFLHAPVKHLTIEEGEYLMFGRSAFAGMDKLESISIESEKFKPNFDGGFSFMKSDFKNLYFYSCPTVYSIQGFTNIMEYTSDYDFYNPYKPFDSAVTDHKDVNIFITNPINNPETDYQSFIELLDGLNKFKTSYGLNDLIASITIPGVGESSAALKDIAKYDLPVRQMWSYTIDKTNKVVKIDDVIPEVKITGVTINGKTVEKSSDGFYHYDTTRAENISVAIKYNLNETKEIVNEYSPSYNNMIESGVEMTIDSSDSIKKDVYNLQGIRILEKASQEEINNLPSGMYIVGKKKVVVKN